jgi:membrane-bound lytic murein transglycosylase D
MKTEGPNVAPGLLCSLLVMKTEVSRHWRISFERVLWTIACLSATGAVALSGATHFGYLPGPQFELTNASPSEQIVVGPPPPPSFALPKSFDREQVLGDYLSRIDDKFNVDETLRSRVGFWFDVYTKYDDNKRILHFSKFPWIVFRVIDVTSIIESDTPRFRWMRNEKAEKFVKLEAAKVRASLKRIARTKNLEKLSPEDLEIAEALRPLGPKIQRSAADAAYGVRMQVGQKNHFEDGLTISSRYLKGMEKIFADQKLPTELTRLPFVESSFNDKATSRVGAAGIWQFMGNTGKKFLLVNDRIDERRSPLKASEAAAKLLKENHLILHHSWPLAVTAWNHGPVGVRKAMAAAGTKDLGLIIRRYRSSSFDFASMNFYSEFLAALYAEKYQDQIFSVTRDSELELQVLKLPRPVRVEELIRVSGLTREQFLSLNPEILNSISLRSYLPAGFRLHVTEQIRLDIERLLAGASDRSGNRKS